MTSEEMVKILRTCESGDCSSRPAPYLWKPCLDRLLIAAAELIERLEKEKAALLGYAKKSAGCEQCKNDGPQCDAVCCISCKKECACASCIKGSRWEWKGVDSDGQADI